MTQLRETHPQRMDNPLPSLSVIAIVSQARAVSFGPRALGDTSEGFRTRLWGAYIDFDGRVYLSPRNPDGSWEGWVERFSLIDPVTSISLAFDMRGRPMIAFVREDRSFGVWYETQPDFPQLVEVGQMPSQFSILAFDQTVSDPEFIGYGDTLLMYGDGGELVIRKASEQFESEHRLELSESYERVWVAQYGHTTNRQFAIRVKG